ncbi:hypothetical protein CTI12_AA628670 [Artemisia annua]|uniref:LRAT domain-containing protein n=1 Tax=Artemisia annua TaxID=35608 RepID=A0A2U1K9J4_ARTAN|nr:hypothetical protein CTI12_AA628670 [Artemisia annua]
MVIHFGPEKDDSISGLKWNVSSVLSSSVTSHSALCLNSHDSGSSLSMCSHCTSWNPNIPASWLRFFFFWNRKDSCLSLPHCGYRQPDSGVIISCLNCFIDTGSLNRFQYGIGKLSYVSNHGGTCTIAKSDPPEEVIKRAVYLLRHGFFSYDVLRNNCEDFALYCTTGLVIRGKVTTGSSGQVNRSIRGKEASYMTDIGVRDDVEEVAVEQVVEFRRRNM